MVYLLFLVFVSERTVMNNEKVILKEIQFFKVFNSATWN